MYRWRQDDPSFAQAYSDAMEARTDQIEQEARRRAVEGHDRPIFQAAKWLVWCACNRINWRQCCSEAADRISSAMGRTGQEPRHQSGYMAGCPPKMLIATETPSTICCSRASSTASGRPPTLNAALMPNSPFMRKWWPTLD
jgi:hypothetical protein